MAHSLDQSARTTPMIFRILFGVKGLHWLRNEIILTLRGPCEFNHRGARGAEPPDLVTTTRLTSG